MNQKTISITSTLILVLIIGLAWGITSQKYEFFPYDIIKDLEETLEGGIDDNRSAFSKLFKHRKIKPGREFPDGLSIKSGLNIIDETFEDTGHLIISRFDGEEHYIEILDISENKVVHRWHPPLQEIIDLYVEKGGELDDSAVNDEGYRFQHPLLIGDGKVVFTSGEGSLVCIDKDSKIVWLRPEHYHHSLELDQNGNILVPLSDKTIGPYRDNSYAIVSKEGELLEQHSITQMMIDNGYAGLLFGQLEHTSLSKHYKHRTMDRIHVNDVQPIFENRGKAQIGDLAFSARHISAIWLYRPSTKEIIWLRVGPWLFPHDITLVPGTNKFSVFGNDNITASNIKNYLSDYEGNKRWGYPKDDTIDIYYYDPESDEITAPFTQIINENSIISGSQGRSNILTNGDAYIEETNRSVLWRISTDNVRWVYYNEIQEGVAGSLHWCRYLDEKTDLSWVSQ